METEGSNIKIYGYYAAGDEWVEIQVDVDGKLVVTV